MECKGGEDEMSVKDTGNPSVGRWGGSVGFPLMSAGETTHTHTHKSRKHYYTQLDPLRRDATCGLKSSRLRKTTDRQTASDHPGGQERQRADQGRSEH